MRSGMPLLFICFKINPFAWDWARNAIALANCWNACHFTNAPLLDSMSNHQVHNSNCVAFGQIDCVAVSQCVWHTKLIFTAHLPNILMKLYLGYWASLKPKTGISQTQMNAQRAHTMPTSPYSLSFTLDLGLWTFRIIQKSIVNRKHTRSIQRVFVSVCLYVSFGLSLYLRLHQLSVLNESHFVLPLEIYFKNTQERSTDASFRTLQAYWV